MPEATPDGIVAGLPQGHVSAAAKEQPVFAAAADQSISALVAKQAVGLCADGGAVALGPDFLFLAFWKVHELDGDLGEG